MRRRSVFHDVTCWLRSQKIQNEDVEDGSVSVHLMDKQIGCVCSSIFMSSKIYFLPHSDTENPCTEKIQCAFCLPEENRRKNKAKTPCKNKEQNRNINGVICRTEKKAPETKCWGCWAKICCSTGKYMEKITNKMKIFGRTNGRCSLEDGY